MGTTRRRTLTNWGAYEIETDGRDITAVHPFAKDPDPSPIGRSLEAVRRSRIAKPAVRESWYRHGPDANPGGRGWEPFVEVEWDEALDLLASELDRVRSEYGNRAIFGGSYGWASAGRFHHAQSQIHRFLNSIGGYTRSVDNYSIAAGRVIIPHIFGFTLEDLMLDQPTFDEIAEHTDLVVAFGGMPIKNSQVHYGGQGRHMVAERLERCRDGGVRFVNLSPIGEDLGGTTHTEWIPMRPSTDVAVMLGLAHSVIASAGHDEAFLREFCHGWDRFRAYLDGEVDGIPKNAAWAGRVSGVDPDRIAELAREMARHRTLVTVSWSVQRTDHGEYAYWAACALAAVIGQIGVEGGGIGCGYGAVGLTGNGVGRHDLPRLEQGVNAVDDYIPVARIADMLLRPGESVEYDGRRLTYPDTKLVYWAGGNPFHHHQDLNRLATAWHRPDTVVVHEPFWNTLARYADFALPATTPLEREDVGGSKTDDFIFWMDRVIDPVGEARDDYEIFSGLAHRLGVADVFTEGRTSDEWLAHIYDRFRIANPGYPSLYELREAGHFQIPHELAPRRTSLLAAFRNDPERAPLSTPSGKIELWSETIERFGYDDAPPYPAWIEPVEWLGAADATQLHLVSNQPRTRLHSQWDHGETSLAGKVDGRERLGMHPEDAKVRGLSDDDVVRVFNERGATLATVAVRRDVMRGVVQLATGAWWDPVEPGGLCRSGNPNVLTRDVGTSSIAQGTTAHSCLVEVERYRGVAPDVRSHDLPRLVSP